MGNALRSISLRVRSYDEETEQLSEDLMDIKGKVIDLTKAESNNGKGISLFTDETQTQYKDLVVYLGEIADVMDEISAKDKQELLELLFGKNRANAGAALLTNYDQVYNVIETIKDSSGSAEREMSTMMESISYKINQFKETLVGIAQGLFSQDFMKSMVDSGTRILNVFDDLTPSISFILKQFANLLELVTKLADTIGGIPLLIAGIGLKNVGNIKAWITDLKQVTMAVDSFKSITQSFKGTGLKAVIDDITVTKYATSIKGLTLEQANLALSTTQLSATEKERVLVEAGLIAQTEALTATDAVYRLQQKLGNKLNAEEILTRAGLTTQKEIEDGTTIKITADKLKEALATGQLSLENYKLIASTFGVEGANYGEAVSFEVLGVSVKKASAALWAFLTTNPVGWAILAGTAIAATVAIVDYFTTSLEESKEQLKDLKDECNGIETDLKSMNDELKTTADRMKELESKDTLTFTEKEEYDNLVKTNNELQRKIDLLELEQKTRNKEKNKTFVQTMELAYTSSVTYGNIDAEAMVEQGEFIDGLLNKLAMLSENNQSEDVQKEIDSITQYLQQKSTELSEIAKDIEYIRSPTTDDDKAVNEWLDYINDFQDQMAIAMGGTNAKSNAFNRLVDNWKFNNVVQGLEDLGKEGKVTAEMLNDPKYDEFIQKLVEIGIIDSADNLDDIALAFNGFGDAVSATDKATNSIYDFVEASEDLKTVIDDTFGNQSTIQSAFDKIQEGTSLSADEVRKLIELCPQLSSEFVKTADGYTIGADKLIKANESVVESTKNSLQERADYLKSFINADYKTDVITGAFEAKKYNEWQQAVASAKTELEGLELILSMFGLTVEDTDDKLEELSKTTSNKVSLISSAMSELNDTGYISSSTYAEIVEMGGNFAECLEIQNGKLTLNIQKLKELEAQEYDNAIAANNLAIAEMQASINSGYDYIRLQEKINELKAQNAFLQTARDEIVNAKPDDNNKPTKDEEPTQITNFKKALAEKQHLVAMKKLSEEEYLNWLDGAYKTAYAGLTGYEDDLYKYEEEIFSKRKELAEKAFDDTIEGIEKEIDALEKLKDNASLDINAEGSIYSVIDQQILLYQQAIDEIGKRIAELEASGLVGIEDEIEELNKQKEDLLEKVYDLGKERTSTGLENEISYWEEMQSKQNDFYDKQIEQLKKQKELLEDKNDEEERAKDLAEKQLELRKAQIALEDARRNRNVLVYTAGGGYSYEADQTAIAEAEEDVKKIKEDLEELRQEEIKDNLDKQIEILEEQKDKDSEYYDTIIKLLEDMSGKNKVQSESNRSIWGQLLATDAGQNALAQIDPEKLQQLLDSGFLVQKDGKYSLAEKKPNEVFKAGTDVIKMLSTLLHKSESEILANDKLMNAVSGGSGIWNSLAMPSQSALSELTKTKSTTVTNYNNSKISNNYRVDKIDIGYSGDDFNGMLEQAFNAMNQGITINGNKVAYGN